MANLTKSLAYVSIEEEISQNLLNFQQLAVLM